MINDRDLIFNFAASVRTYWCFNESDLFLN